MSGAVDPRPCFFLGMELLDNLPHDKIAWTAPTVEEALDSSRAPSRARGATGAADGGGSRREELCEAVVLGSPGGFREAFRPLRDPAICELLAFCPDLAAMVKPRGQPAASHPGSDRADGEVEYHPGKFLGEAFFAGLFGKTLPPDHRAAFVPTGSLRLVQALRNRLPRHRAILADFDSFAGSGADAGGEATTVMGGGARAGEAGGGGEGGRGGGNDESLTAFQAPIVSSRDPSTGEVTDHSTYMVPLGSADIFFPTCFTRLSRLHAAICSRDGGGGGGGGAVGEVKRGRGLVVKQGEFMREHADLRATRTFSGFNPLVDDFRNSSVFVSGAIAP